MKKEKIFFYILSFFLLNDNFLYATENNNIQQMEKQVEKEESRRFKETFKTFIKSYIFTKENQIFRQNKYGVFFTYGVSVNKNKKGTLIDITDTAGKIYENDTDFIEYNTETKLYYKYKWNGKYKYKAVGNASLHYSVPDRLMHINGRLSLGFFSWHGLNTEYNHRFKALGIEFIQEFIFGTPMFYLTVGIGPAYVFPFKHYNSHTNMASQFFFAIVANIGHRFDNGMILEAGIKHYSNGETQPPNYGLNVATITLGYTF